MHLHIQIYLPDCLMNILLDYLGGFTCRYINTESEEAQSRSNSKVSG